MVKDTPVTQEISWILGALYEESEIQTQYSYYCTTDRDGLLDLSQAKEGAVRYTWMSMALLYIMGY